MTFSYYYKNVSAKFMFNASLDFTILNERNDKRFNNRGYSLFFLMGIFLKHL